MKRVMIVNLAGRAWHVEEAGVAVLESWLDTARTRLATDPDRDELVLDFERAIADRCEHVAPGERDVVTEAQVNEILAALGPVEPAEEADAASTEPNDARATATEDIPWRERKLYRLTGPDESMVAGVCSGLAAYLNVDVSVVRLVVVLLTILTSGVAIIGYIVLAFVVPEAKRPDQRAAAFGHGQTAQELMARARVQASPALATLGSMIGRTSLLFVRGVRWLLLAAIWVVLALWTLAVGSLVFEPHAVLDAFDPGTSSWIAALWLTCLAWVPIVVLLLLERGVARLDPRSAAPSRTAGFAVSGAIAVSGLAALLGAIAIPASYSRPMVDLAENGTPMQLFGQEICVEDSVGPRIGCDERVDVQID